MERGSTSFVGEKPQGGDGQTHANPVGGRIDWCDEESDLESDCESDSEKKDNQGISVFREGVMNFFQILSKSLCKHPNDCRNHPK